MCFCEFFGGGKNCYAGDFGDGIIYGTKNLTITSSQLPVVAEGGLELLPGAV